MTDDVKRYWCKANNAMFPVSEGMPSTDKDYYVLASDHDAAVTALREQLEAALRRIDVMLDHPLEKRCADLTAKLKAAEGELHRQQVALDRSSDGAYLDDVLQENDCLRALVEALPLYESTAIFTVANDETHGEGWCVDIENRGAKGRVFLCLPNQATADALAALLTARQEMK